MACCPVARLLVENNLEQYASVFEDEGFDDLTSLLSMCQSTDGFAELVECTGLKRGHAVRLKKKLLDMVSQQETVSGAPAHPFPKLPLGGSGLAATVVAEADGLSKFSGLLNVDTHYSRQSCSAAAASFLSLPPSPILEEDRRQHFHPTEFPVADPAQSEWAVVAIQARFRGNESRAAVRRAVVARWRASVRIQSAARGSSGRRAARARAYARAQERAATIVQAAYRGHTDRQLVSGLMAWKCEERVLHRGATVLQSLARGRGGRRAAALARLDRVERATAQAAEEARAVLMLHCAARQFLACHRAARLRLRRDSAALAGLVGRLWRGRQGRRHFALARQQRNADLERERSDRALALERLLAASCLRIQSQYRRHAASSRFGVVLARHRQALREASSASCLQRLARSSSARSRAADLRRHRAQRASAVCIQRVVRGRGGRRQAVRVRLAALETLRTRHFSCLAIQSAWRGHFLGRRVAAAARADRAARVRAARRAAAVCLQASRRGCLGRREASEKRGRLVAAGKIQSAFKQFKSRCLFKYLAHERLRQRSACRVQACARGHQARCLVGQLRARLLALRLRQAAASGCIQCGCRCFLSRRASATLRRLRDARHLCAAVAIQAALRGAASRARTRHLLRLKREDRQRALRIAGVKADADAAADAAAKASEDRLLASRRKREALVNAAKSLDEFWVGCFGGCTTASASATASSASSSSSGTTASVPWELFRACFLNEYLPTARSCRLLLTNYKLNLLKRLLVRNGDGRVSLAEARQYVAGNGGLFAAFIKLAGDVTDPDTAEATVGGSGGSSGGTKTSSVTPRSVGAPRNVNTPRSTTPRKAGRAGGSPKPKRSASPRRVTVAARQV